MPQVAELARQIAQVSAPEREELLSRLNQGAMPRASQKPEGETPIRENEEELESLIEQELQEVRAERRAASARP